MTNLTLGILQGNFRSAFAETMPAVAAVADRKDELSDADIRHNIELFKALAREAGGRGANLVIGPETFIDGWSARADITRRVATTIPGPLTDELGELARELKIWICAGLFEQAADRIYNAAVLIDADGRLAGTYRKTHETRDMLDRMPYALGDALRAFDSPWGRLGLLICHDRWYPENARTLARQGVKLVLNPTATAVFHPRHAYHEIHRCVLRSQAYLNRLWWACCNAGNHGGHSVVVDPLGQVTAAAADAQQVLLTTIRFDPAAGYDFLSNLRPEATYAVTDKTSGT